MPKGSGVRISQQRVVDAFARLVINIRAEGEILVGPRQKVIVEIDDNLMSLVTTEVVDDVLNISSSEELSSKRGLRVTIGCDILKSITVRGDIVFQIAGLHGANFSLMVDGKARLRATGSVAKEEIHVNGMGAEIDLYEVSAGRSIVLLNGTGIVKITATEQLDATVNGLGKVRYRGDPKSVMKQVNGFGSIEPG